MFHYMVCVWGGSTKLQLLFINQTFWGERAKASVYPPTTLLPCQTGSCTGPPFEQEALGLSTGVRTHYSLHPADPLSYLQSAKPTNFRSPVLPLLPVAMTITDGWFLWCILSGSRQNKMSLSKWLLPWPGGGGEGRETYLKEWINARCTL